VSRVRRLSVCTLATTVGPYAHRVLLARSRAAGRIDEVQLVHRLLDELIPVRQDQGAPATALHQEGKHNRLAGPGGKTSSDRCTPRAVAASRAATASYW